MARDSGLYLQSLSQRIVQAARLAASVHLFESLRDTSQHFGRGIAVGAAGPVTPGNAREFSHDGSESRIGILTDDEPVAIASPARDVARRPSPCSDGAD